jgi:hypothetical protein
VTKIARKCGPANAERRDLANAALRACATRTQALLCILFVYSRVCACPSRVGCVAPDPPRDARSATCARSPRTRAERTRAQKRAINCVLHVHNTRACHRARVVALTHCGAPAACAGVVRDCGEPRHFRTSAELRGLPLRARCACVGGM